MVLRFSGAILVVAVACIAWQCSGDTAMAEKTNNPYATSQRNLSHNFYVPPRGYNGVGAQMYLSPLPTPPLVGHTWITYEPLMPHEFLYPHKRTYVRHHPCGNTTRTRVRWR